MERFLVFIPVYNCERQITRVLAKFDVSMKDLFSEILIVDNRSTDNTLISCQEAMQYLPIPSMLIQNQANYHLGGSHKVAFNYALSNHYQYVIVLHGDDQGDIRDIIPYLRQQMHHHYDCLLGGRFMKQANLINYSKVRTLGNYFFNLLFSLACRHKLYDLGSGLNVYHVPFLQSQFYLKFPNALTFNYYMILYTVAIGAKIHFFPVSWKEEDQVSNVRLFQQTSQLFKLLKQFCFEKQSFLFDNHAQEQSYTYQKISHFNVI